MGKRIHNEFPVFRKHVWNTIKHSTNKQRMVNNYMEKFKSLGLSNTTISALKDKGFEEPTPIQEATIPLLLQGEFDVVGQAQTGTGKTAAFGLPIIEKINNNSRAVQTLVLVPTRELALQVSEELNSLKGKKKLNIVPIYGGQSMEQQISKLKRGIDIVVGTPGRVLDHIKRKRLKLQNISYLVLDEADEMLNMGFIEDIEKILESANPDRKTLLFSATMPKEIIAIAKNYMREYQVVKVTKQQLTTNLTEQIYFQVNESDKFEALCRIIDIESEFYGLVFCRTKNDVGRIAGQLIDRGYDADGMHGDISQYQREEVLNKFRKQRINVLVATDVAARGMDIKNLTHVINYALPQDSDSYVHRIGRTGRAGKEGTAITFVTPSEFKKITRIQKAVKSDIRLEKIPRIREIVRAKRARIKRDIFTLVNEEIDDSYIKMANDLLEENDSERVLAALLKYAFHKQLDTSNYSEIGQLKTNNVITVDQKGKTRLFIALGKEDGMSEKKLVRFIKTGTTIRREKINNIRLFDEYSFVTVPFKEAEIILKMFGGKKNPGQRPIIERAKMPANGR